MGSQKKNYFAVVLGLTGVIHWVLTLGGLSALQSSCSATSDAVCGRTLSFPWVTLFGELLIILAFLAIAVKPSLPKKFNTLCRSLLTISTSNLCVAASIALNQQGLPVNLIFSSPPASNVACAGFAFLIITNILLLIFFPDVPPPEKPLPAAVPSSGAHI